ncbi:urease accessory protein [Tabrizicola sp. TH137]|uniref:HupE/UreJ family protein n=1 Tax=Tabrizicola sp. TH137 TaxID=2067452 RepID=UPI000C7D5A26|nr:HupE/UreJ family protein [Tabrizicola sp. TH137]PLL12444.1 urease accessory protein [Tabrizicola sp. TH137]
MAIRSSLLLSAVLAALPAAVLAHEGHGSGFLAGAGHPIGGTDHLLAMLAVGLWAAMLGGRALWVLPLAFVTAMLAGGGMGHAGLPLPGVEPMILASVILVGVAAALALRLPLGWAALGVAAFGLFHGHAHGMEGPQDGLALFAAGFALATLALHMAGLGIGLALNALAGRGVLRMLGLGTVLGGLSLIFG